MKGLIIYAFIAVLLLQQEATVFAAAIIGVDFGTNFIKVAYVQPGKAFDIVENKNSKRKSDNVLGIDRGQRLYAADAAGLASRDPLHVIMRSRDLLGTTIDGPHVRHLEEALGISYDLVPDEETGSFKVVLDMGTDKELQFRPEEIVGMILSYVKDISRTHTETDVTDCVITVPPFFNQIQREALLNAATIAGLNVLTLADENVAAAVQHGVYNEFNETHKLLIYNMGSASTKVTLFNFWGKPGIGKNAKANTQVEVVSKAWDETLGGDSLDMLLTNIIADAFDKEHYGGEETVRSSRRAMERIRKQACKVKTVLSANVEIPISMESLHQGKDIRLHITRAKLEEAAHKLFERVTKPIDRVLQDAGIEVKDLDSIELIGGGIRVPKVKEILSKYFNGMELGNHLNGDEAKCFGAVFIGANMSKTFRVRPVGLVDRTTDPVIVELNELSPSPEEPWQKDAVLFNASNPLNAKKIVSFRHETDIVSTLVRQVGEERVPFAQYEVKGVDEAIEKFGKFGKPKISLTYLLSHSDTVGLVKADAVFVEEIIPEPEPEEPEEAAEEKKEDDGEKKEGSEEEKKDDAKEGEEEDKKKKKKKSPPKPTKKTHRFPLSVVRTDSILTLKRLSPDHIKSAREILAEWDAKEEEKRNHEAVKNQLESFIFSSRDRVRSNEEQVDKVLSEADKEELFDDLMALEDWLDEEGADAEVSEYKSKRSIMDKRIKKIFRRVDELDQRPATVRAARQLLETIRTQVADIWPKERPWLSEAEKEYVLKVATDFEEWLTNAEAEQDKTSLQEDPVLTSAEIAKQLEQVHGALEAALKRPKPRPPPPKKKPKQNTTKKEETKTEEGAEGKDKDETEAEPAGETGDGGDSDGEASGKDEVEVEKDEL